MIFPNRQPPCEGQLADTRSSPYCCGTAENPVTSKTATRTEPPRNRWNTFTSFLLSVGVVFFPKCPICWAAYMSLFSALGFESISYQPWMLPVMIVLLLANLVLLGYATKQKKSGPGPLALSIGGIALVLGGKFLLDAQTIIYIGLSLMLIGTAWSAVPNRFNRTVTFLTNKIKLLLPVGQKELR